MDNKLFLMYFLITYCRFPKDELIKQKWQQILRKQRRERGWISTKHSRICSLHFRPQDMYMTDKGYRRISKSAVPLLRINASGGEPSTSKPSKKKRKQDDVLETDETDSEIEDEYDSWAKECAFELRQMAPDQETFAKAAITYILMEGRKGNLHKNSVQINEILVETTEEDHTDSPLDEFLVIRKGVGSNSAAMSPKDTATSGSALSPVDPGTSSVTASHKTAKRRLDVKRKSLGKTGATGTVKTSRKTATSSLTSSSSHDDTGTSFVIGSHRTAAPVVASSPPVKTEPLDDVGSSSVIKCEVSATLDEPSSIVDEGRKAEFCDETAFCSLPASHERASERDPLSSSPSHMKSEPNSPPSSPDFTVVFKEEPE